MGGGGIPVTRNMLNKDYCKAMAKDYTGTTGLDEDRIAQEIYAHAVLYLLGAGIHIMDAIKGIPFASSVSEYLMKCGEKVDLGNDTWYEVAIFKAIWYAGV